MKHECAIYGCDKEGIHPLHDFVEKNITSWFCDECCKMFQNDQSMAKVFYSAEDVGYIAQSTSEPGLSAFGVTPEQAMAEFKTAEKLFFGIKSAITTDDKKQKQKNETARPTRG